MTKYKVTIECEMLWKDNVPKEQVAKRQKKLETYFMRLLENSVVDNEKVILIIAGADEETKNILSPRKLCKEEIPNSRNGLARLIAHKPVSSNGGPNRSKRGYYVIDLGCMKQASSIH